MLYFGVGGGVIDFERSVKDAGGEVTIIMEKSLGVGRRMMLVEWNRIPS